MAKRLTLSLTLLMLLSASSAYAETFGAVLTGSQETPSPVTSPGYGYGTVTLDPTHTTVTVDMIVVTPLTTPIVGGHIHGPGARGAGVGVKVNFDFPNNIASGRMNRTFPIDKAVADDLALHPELYYLNVHTSQHGGGEIRGQLAPLDNVVAFAADLRGAKERPTPVTTNATGSAFVTIDQNNILTWDVNATTLVSPTLGHIHRGGAETAGSPVVTFASGASAFTGSRLRGSADIGAALAAEIKANPSGFYVNVHTSANGGGEIRGQLVPANEYDIAAGGKVTGVRGENFVTDVRVFNPSFSDRASALLEYFQAGDQPNSTATNSIALDIPPRGTAVVNDVAGTGGVNLPNTTGALRVTSATQLVLSSRIYDDRRSRNGGTIGQFVPGSPKSSRLRKGALAQLAQSGEARTNVGFSNPNAATVDVRLELRDEAGNRLGVADVVLAGLSNRLQSLPALFPGADLTNRPALAVTFDASAPVSVYASVLDAVSSDQIFVSASPDPGSPVP